MSRRAKEVVMKRKKRFTPLWVDLIILDVAISLFSMWSRLLHGWPRGLLVLAVIAFRGLYAALKARKPRASDDGSGKRHSL